MQNTQNRKQLLIVGVIIFAAILLVSIIYFFASSLTQKKTSIAITNYDQTVQNLSKEMKTSMESFLYLIVSVNVEGELDGSKVNDAQIRGGSYSQNYTDETGYDGEFVIDIDSLQQSYRVAYAYLPSNPDLVGQPVYIGCVKPEQVRYKSFECKQIAADQEDDETIDPVIQYLPYSNLSFSATADATNPDTFIIRVQLIIPQSYLSSNEATRREAVAAYKSEFTDWMESNGLNVTDYTIQYNYDDAGNAI